MNHLLILVGMSLTFATIVMILITISERNPNHQHHDNNTRPDCTGPPGDDNDMDRDKVPQMTIFERMRFFDELTRYETCSFPWIHVHLYPWMINLSAKYITWKVRRKARRYFRHLDNLAARRNRG